MRNKLSMTVALLALVLVAGCKVEKAGDDTYKVTTPTPEAKADAQKAKDDASRAGAEVKSDARDVGNKVSNAAHDVGQSEAAQQMKDGAVKFGRGVKEGVGEAAQATGSALKKAGHDLHESARPEGSTTTKTTVTTTTVKTSTEKP
jgi:hypothetical protein